jgi:hypothetical protein
MFAYLIKSSVSNLESGRRGLFDWNVTSIGVLLDVAVSGFFVGFRNETGYAGFFKYLNKNPAQVGSQNLVIHTKRRP